MGVRSIGRLDSFLGDLRHAWRQLSRAPSFAVVAVLTLGIGIGANAAIFGAIDEILLAPLPYSEADRIVTLWQTDDAQGVAQDDVAPGNFLDWRERSRSFEVLAAAEPFSLDYVGVDGPEEFRNWLVTEGFFDVFGTQPLVGRTFRAEDFIPGAPRVALVSHWLWQSRFGGDLDLVGSVMTLDGAPTTIVGVMPPEFAYPVGRDVWVPKIIQPFEPEVRASASWQVVGKLGAGVSLDAARAELDAIAAQLAAEYPGSNAGRGISLVPLADHLVGDVRSALLLFGGAVALVLLIVCANIANLLLARAASRRREFALRAVLGADRSRMVRLLITESLLIAALGAAVGVLIAGWGLSAIEALRPAGLLDRQPLALDGAAIAFACLLALATAFVFGLVPAFDAANTDLRARVSAAAGSTGSVRGRFRSALVVAELAIATLLLVGTGLLLRSFVALQQTDRGFHTDNVLAFTVQAWGYYPDPPRRTQFVEQTLERIGALPGIRSAGIASSLPLANVIGADTATFAIPDRPRAESDGLPIAHATVASNGYFESLRIPLRAGRLFEPTDDADAPFVVVINETMARRYWPGEDPLGAMLRFAFAGPPVDAEVVGIVGDVRLAPHEEPRPSLYVPHAQAPTGGLHFVVRTPADPAAIVRPVQREIWTTNATMPISGPVALDRLLDDAFSQRRFTLGLVWAFAATALALAAIGTYGLLSHDARSRAREIGVRMALGAQRRSVVRLVVGAGLKLAVIGIAVGTVAAVASGGLLRGFLYGVSPFDPVTYVAIALVLVAAAALASFLPARRAAHIDPMRTLREE